MRPQPANPYSNPERMVTLEIVPDAPPKQAGARSVDAAGRLAKKVLLLEDRDDFREILREHLTMRGFQVTSVPSGVEGLCEIKKSAFDIIICDMLMPGSGGEMFYWAVTRLRPATAQRFIFFTGHPNNPTFDYFFRRVNATVLIKPFPLADLDANVSSILRKLA